MNKKLGFIVCVLLCFSIISCEPKSHDDGFSKWINVENVENINTDVTLDVMTNLKNDFTNKGKIYLGIRNNSNNNIWFSSDCNAQIFMRSKEGSNLWVAVKNRIVYHGDGNVIVPVHGEGVNLGLFVVSPDLDNEFTNQDIRIVVTGIIMENGVKTDKAVSAYVDVTLHR